MWEERWLCHSSTDWPAVSNVAKLTKAPCFLLGPGGWSSCVHLQKVYFLKAQRENRHGNSACGFSILSTEQLISLPCGSQNHKC